MPEEQQNVVIIGLSCAGVGVVKNLLKAKLPEKYRIVCIEANKYAYWPVGSLRASVVPGFEKRIVADFDDIFPKKSGHALLKGTKVIAVKKRHVVIDKARPDQGFASTEIPYAIVVVATGSSYPFPCRPLPSADSKEDAMSDLARLQSDLRNSGHIVVAGGGPVGIEIAGEIICRYPDKNVTIVTEKPYVAHEGLPSKFGTILIEQLQRHGVKVVVGVKVLGLEDSKTGRLARGSKVKLSNNTTIESDFLFLATGNRPNNGLLLDTFPSCRAQNDRIKVLPSLQIDAVEHGASKVLAVGDINDSKVVTAFLQHREVCEGQLTNIALLGIEDSRIYKAEVAARSVVSILTSGKSAKHKPMGTGQFFPVSIGPKGGAVSFAGFTFGPWIASASKGKNQMLSVFQQMYSSPKS